MREVPEITLDSVYSYLWECAKIVLVLLVKEKEDAHTDPEVQPMKDDDIIFGEYR